MMKASAAVAGHDIVSPPPLQGTDIPIFPDEHRLLRYGLRHLVMLSRCKLISWCLLVLFYQKAVQIGHCQQKKICSSLRHLIMWPKITKKGDQTIFNIFLKWCIDIWTPLPRRQPFIHIWIPFSQNCVLYKKSHGAYKWSHFPNVM